MSRIGLSCCSDGVTRGVWWRRLIVVAAFGVLMACDQGAPYAFRLMIPPYRGQYLPYRFWEERRVFQNFKNCLDERDAQRVGAFHEFELRKLIEEGRLQREQARARYAECVPLR